MSINSDIQKLQPGTIVDLYELDMSNLNAGVLYLHPGKNGLVQDIRWKGIPYKAFPIKAEGFEATGNGRMPRPTVKVANVTTLISSLLRQFDDLIGCKLTRRRTFSKYLDPENFPAEPGYPNGRNDTADSTQEFPPEVWFIDRKSVESKMMIEFELAASWDVQGVLLPRRQAIANTCNWTYRSADCGYAGGPVADGLDVATTDPTRDVCGKRLVSCKIRNGEHAVLPFGAFIAVGVIQ